MAEIDIGKIFSDFSEEIKSQIDKELKTIARETVSELNATSPKKSGDFARGWRYLSTPRKVSDRLPLHPD